MEFLSLILVIVMVVLYNKMSNRVSALEKELEAVKADILKRQTLPATVEAAAPATAEESLPPVEIAAREAIAPAETEATQPVAAEDLGTGQETLSPAAAPAIPQTAAADTVSARPTPARPAKPKDRESLESYLGARWPVWVGGVALAFGGIFLVRYSIEAGLLGPAARMTLAVIFGLVLMAAGELVRRRAMPQISERFANAMIPGALTAAGAVTLLGATFASYAVYGFIGPTPAFILLALISFATIALSLLHGQALAGLGLLASLVTPGLISTSEPNGNALFGFLALTWMAVNAASRYRQWTVVPTLANIGIGLWAIAYTFGQDDFALPVTLALVVMVAGTAFFWPGRYYGIIGPSKPGISMLLGRPPLQITLSVSIMILFSALAMVIRHVDGSSLALFGFACLMAVLAAFGAGRTYAVWPAMIAAAGTLIGMVFVVLAWMDAVPSGVIPVPADGQMAQATTFTNEVSIFLGLGAIFTLLGIAFLRRFRAQEPDFSIIWAYLMAAVPVKIAFISFFNFGNLGRDWTHGLYGLAIGLVLLAVTEWISRRDEDEQQRRIDWPASILIAGSFAAFTLCLHALTNGIVTTILLSVLGFAYVLAARVRNWPALPWMMAAAIIIVFGRIAWEPTLIGPQSLGKTPFLNALLPGYGIPTLLAIVTAWMLRNSADYRIRNIMQALGALASLTTVAVLVRHAMNGGVLEGNAPSLGEQSIYTLVTVGFSGILMTLDLKSPSPVFRFGSMIAGVIATLNVLSLHVFALNPYFSGENTGSWPFVNLLLIGYLMPAFAYGLVAYYARGRRPMPYVIMLALAGAVLGFLWATLSVRRFWQGQNIADWKGFMQGETYTYSVVWLLIGVLMLILGSRFDARSLRLASAGLVLVAVVKVFLIDMSNLEGILRALSFIGLGAVLIGIGLFYQRILMKKGGNSAAADSPDDPEKAPSA